jgi:two-component system sensor histidine kinase KdpD
VQHLESKSEAVTQIAGIPVRETVPDEIFEKAYEIELIDLTPDELIQRLNEGKIYVMEKSAAAIENFFKEENITALREMALRIVADRVDRKLHEYMQSKGIKGPWKSGLHLLVAIGASPHSARLLRWAKSLSYSMGATIEALYIESGRPLNKKQSSLLDKNINLAKSLGIGFSIVSNPDKVKGIVNYARKENISHIIVGKPQPKNLHVFFKVNNFINRLIRYSGDIDVYILSADSKISDKFKERATYPSFTSDLRQYLTAMAFLVFTSLICYMVKDLIGYQTISFILLFLVSILAIFFGIGPVLLAATSSAFI